MDPVAKHGLAFTAVLKSRRHQQKIFKVRLA